MFIFLFLSSEKSFKFSVAKMEEMGLYAGFILLIQQFVLCQVHCAQVLNIAD